MSERGIKQFTEKICVNCQTPFGDNDVVILNAVGDDLALMNNKLNERREAMKIMKKQKKKKGTESGTSTNDEKSSCKLIASQSKPTQVIKSEMAESSCKTSMYI